MGTLSTISQSLTNFIEGKKCYNEAQESQENETKVMIEQNVIIEQNDDDYMIEVTLLKALEKFAEESTPYSAIYSILYEAVTDNENFELLKAKIFRDTDEM